jgi:Flp pilus assembly protein TadG
MAIVSLFLFTMVFGIVDFGWAFMKNLDVRHGAREVGRLAAVNYDGATPTGAAQAQRLVNVACDRMDGDTGTNVTLDLSDDGSNVKVTVVQNFRGLTGFFDAVLPTTLTSTVTMRMEQSESFEDTDADPDTYTCS